MEKKAYNTESKKRGIPMFERGRNRLNMHSSISGALCNLNQGDYYELYYYVMIEYVPGLT